MLCEKCKHLIGISGCEKNEDGTYGKRKIMRICGMKGLPIEIIDIDECNSFERKEECD